MTTTFAQHLVEAASRRVHEGSGSVQSVAVALQDYAALLPASSSNLGPSPEDGQATCSGRLAEACSSMLSSKQGAMVVTGCDLLCTYSGACPAHVFLQHQQQWSQLLVALLQRQQQLADDVWLAAAGALVKVYQRVGALLDGPGVRRSAATCTAKLLPVLAPLLSPRAAAAASGGGGNGTPAAATGTDTPAGTQAADRRVAAVLLLGAVLGALPQSMRAQAKQVEAGVAEALAAGGPPGLRAAAVAAVARLPRITGTPESWSSTAQQLLWAAHLSLDGPFAELEPQQGADRQLGLDPAAADGPLAAVARSHAASAGLQQRVQLYGACMSALQQMMEAPFAAPAPLPMAGVMHLAARVQAMAAVIDVGTGHSRHSLAKRSDLQHAASRTLPPALVLLRLSLQALGGGVLQHAREASELLGRGLRRVATGGTPHLPSEAELYNAVRCLLYRGGPAAARWLAPDVMDVALWRLYGLSTAAGGAGGGGGGQQAGGPSAPPAKKQRRGKGGKGSAADDAAAQQQAFEGSAFLGSPLAAAHRQLDCEVLSLLEALLVSGAALLPASLRLKTDAVVAHVALSTSAAADKLRHCEGGDAAEVGGLQLAAYRALLASVLAPLGHRPPFLGEALALFRGGAHSQHEPLMQFCRQAMLYCEPLLHPRAVPVPIPLDAANPASEEEVGRVPAFAASLFSDIRRAVPSWRQQQQQPDGNAEEANGMEVDRPGWQQHQQQPGEQLGIGSADPASWENPAGWPSKAGAEAAASPLAPVADQSTGALIQPSLQLQQPARQSPVRPAAAPATAPPAAGGPTLAAAAQPPSAAADVLATAGPSGGGASRVAGGGSAAPLHPLQPPAPPQPWQGAAAASAPARGRGLGDDDDEGGDSEDSEGPLPEIDSGPSSDDE